MLHFDFLPRFEHLFEAGLSPLLVMVVFHLIEKVFVVKELNWNFFLSYILHVFKLEVAFPDSSSFKRSQGSWTNWNQEPRIISFTYQYDPQDRLDQNSWDW